MNKKIFFSIILAISIMISFVPVNAEYYKIDSPRVIDNSKVLSGHEKRELIKKADELSRKGNMDVRIMTTDDFEGKSPEEFTDDIFDYSGYGIGDNHSGLILVVNPVEHKWHISTSGDSIKAFTDEGIDYIGKQIKPYFVDEDYGGALKVFLKLTDDALTSYQKGRKYKGSKKVPIHWIPASIIIGFLIARYIVMRMKSKLNSVREDVYAYNYMNTDSLNFSDASDRFLYSTISVAPLPNDDDGGSASSTHQSSSGNTHGGGGGSW